LGEEDIRDGMTNIVRGDPPGFVVALPLAGRLERGTARRIRGGNALPRCPGSIPADRLGAAAKESSRIESRTKGAFSNATTRQLILFTDMALFGAAPEVMLCSETDPTRPERLSARTVRATSSTRRRQIIQGDDQQLVAGKRSSPPTK
jgi:hypothetical protein